MRDITETETLLYTVIVLSCCTDCVQSTRRKPLQRGQKSWKNTERETGYPPLYVYRVPSIVLKNYVRKQHFRSKRNAKKYFKWKCKKIYQKKQLLVLFGLFQGKNVNISPLKLHRQSAQQRIYASSCQTEVSCQRLDNFQRGKKT